MKSIRIFMLALMLTVFTAGVAFAQTINVVNSTGFTIMQLGLAHESASGDADDLLGEGVLDSGYQLPVNISGPTTGWELIAVDGDGGQVNWQNLDLTGVSSIILHGDGTADLQ